MREFEFFIPFQKAPILDPATGYQHLHGIASTMDVDRDIEQMSPRALNKMIKTINTGKVNLFMDHEHDALNAIGVLERAWLGPDQTSAQTDIRLENSDSPMSPVPYLLDKLSSGINLGLSVGGRVTEQHDEYDKKSGQKIGVIDDVELYEVSVVGIPSNPFAGLSIEGQIAKSAKYPVLKKTLGDIWRAEGGRIVKKEIGIPDSNVQMGQSAPVGHNQTELNACSECGALKGELIAQNPNGTILYKCRACGAEFIKDLMVNSTISTPSEQPMHETRANVGTNQDVPIQHPAPTSSAGGMYKSATVTFTREEFSRITKAIKAAQRLSKDAEAQNNPWAICNAALGSDADPGKLESCIRQVKESTGYKEGETEKVKTEKDAEAEEEEEAEAESEAEATVGRPLKKPKSKFVKEGESESAEEAEEEEEEEGEPKKDEDKVPENKEAESESEDESPGEEAEHGTTAGHTLTPGFATPSQAQYQTQTPGVPGTGRGIGTQQDVPPQHPLKAAKGMDLQKMVQMEVSKQVKKILSNSPSLIKAINENVGPETLEPKVLEKSMPQVPEEKKPEIRFRLE